MLFRRAVLSFFAGVLLVSLTVSASAGNVGANCTLKGKALYGRVQVVDVFPDFRVQVVDSFPDIRVQRVDVFPNSCGRWQFVDTFPDFKVQFVDTFPDLRIQYVDVFPGH